MTKRKRTNGQIRTIQWQKEKEQSDKYRQYNDNKKDKRTSTDNTMTKRKRTNGQVQTIQ